MTSAVDVANQALGWVGERPNISSLVPPDGPHADKLARAYPLAQRAILEMKDWSFARKRKTLARLSDNPSTYLYAYALPAGCLKPRKLINTTSVPGNGVADLLSRGYDPLISPQPPAAATEQTGINFIVEDGVLFTDEEAPVLLYTFEQDDLTRWSPLAILALSYYMASMVAPAIKGDPKAGIPYYQLSQQTLAEGAQSNANVGQTSRDYTAPWITYRL